MCLELAPAGSRTLVGFGDWSAVDSAGLIKKSSAGPVKKFEKRLKQYCTVISVDEFRTSKLHHKCGQVLKHQRSHKMICKKTTREVVTQRIHSVLFCCNKSCHGIAMDRDENASRNMLQLLMKQVQHDSRPSVFRRGTVLPLASEMCTGAPLHLIDEGEASVYPATPGLP